MDTKYLHLRKGTIVEDVEEAIKNLKVMVVSEEPKALKEAEWKKIQIMYHQLNDLIKK